MKPQQKWYVYDVSGQITTIHKPESKGFGGDSLIKPAFKVTSAEVAMICSDVYSNLSLWLLLTDSDPSSFATFCQDVRHQKKKTLIFRALSGI